MLECRLIFQAFEGKRLVPQQAPSSAVAAFVLICPAVMDQIKMKRTKSVGHPRGLAR